MLLFSAISHTLKPYYPFLHVHAIYLVILYPFFVWIQTSYHIQVAALSIRWNRWPQVESLTWVVKVDVGMSVESSNEYLTKCLEGVGRTRQRHFATYRSEGRGSSC